MQPSRAIQRWWRRFPIGPFDLRLAYDISRRPGYTYGIYQAARTARSLGIPRITIIEFGVAGGNGLLEIEQACSEITRELGVEFDIYGFDTGSGLPPPTDFRDTPYLFGQGQYQMDEAALRNKLQRAKLVLGNVSETVPEFLAKTVASPIGFVSIDLDFYSSTADALRLFETDHRNLIPRVFCYFDDVIGDDWQLHSEWAGELLAIKEFNAAHEARKIAPINGLRHKRRMPAGWNDRLFVLHSFEHPLYNTYILPNKDQQLSLE